jgi:predicted hotdog family 3-hydroxylacyl-ACP dehydratase
MQIPDITTLPASQLTAHQAPALLVERILSVRTGGGRVRLAAHAGLDALQLIEASAQAVAVLMGGRLRKNPGGAGARASGMLVGAKDFVIGRTATPGEVVEIEADLGIELGPLQLYRVVVHGAAAGQSEAIGSGELKVAASGGVT